MTTDKKIVSFSALIVAFSVLYYLVYFIPNKDKRDFLIKRESECLKLYSDYLETQNNSKKDGFIGGRVKYVESDDRCYGDYSFVWDTGYSAYIIEHFSDTNIVNYSELNTNNIKTGDKEGYKKKVSEIFEK